jgi:hypothetical protein
LLQSAEEAAGWAHRILPVKNTLTFGDARLLEEAFESQMAVICGASAHFEHCSPSSEVTKAPLTLEGETIASIEVESVEQPRSDGATVDKGGLALPEPRRLRDKFHKRFVSTQPCLICGRQPSDAHHLRFAQPRALGRKVSDEFTVPLCRGHHRELHRCGNESQWWKSSGVDPLLAAAELWAKTHPLPPAHQPAGTDDSIKAVEADAGAVPQLPNKRAKRKTKPILVARSQ